MARQFRAQPLALDPAVQLAATPLKISAVLEAGDQRRSVLNSRLTVTEGSRVRVHTKFYDEVTGDLVSLSDIILVSRPNGGLLTDPVTMEFNEDTGEYEGSFVVDQPGVWMSRISVPEPNEFVREINFYVSSSQVI